MKKLEKTYGNTYQMDNVALSGTHTHAAPGGFNEYTMYDIPNLGFVKETHRALISGICDVSVLFFAFMSKILSKVECPNSKPNKSPLTEYCGGA